MITVEQSWNFEFFRRIDQNWFDDLLLSEQLYAIGKYHTCSSNIRTFFESCIVQWIYDTKKLTLPEIKPGDGHVRLIHKIQHKPFKKSVSNKNIRRDMHSLPSITNQPSHACNDTFDKNPKNAANALEKIHRIVSWFYQEFHYGNPLEIPNFTLPQSQETFRSEQLIVSKLQNTHTNGHDLQERNTTLKTTLQENILTQEHIMALVNAAAPIKKEEAIAALSEKLNLPRVEENIHILITDNILKQASATLLVNRAHAKSQAIQYNRKIETTL